MKMLSRSLALFALTAFAAAPVSVRAQDVPPPPDQGGDQGDQGASFQTFYDQLGSQGTWVQTDDYGYVFQPNVSDPNWAPYTDGHWVYTDAGWTWVSDEPWGWATYHYGRWANIDGTGWVWVPGYRWAPAWVSWRYGGGYAGWAPLPPETFVGAEYGGRGGWATFHFGNDVDVNFNIGPGCYNFVSVGDLGERNYGGRYLDRSRNYTVINRTTNVTNINVTNNYYGSAGAAGNFRGVSTGGPSIDEVNAHSRTHLQTVQLTAANQAGRSTLQGNSLAVYAPRVNAASLRTARPTSVAKTIAHPTFNRGDTITKPLAVNAALKPAAPSAEAIAAAKEARAHVPATARIATATTHIKTPITKPLSAMTPAVATHATPSAVKPASASVEHPSASAPFTGETPKPATTYHPEAEEKPAATYHPQAEAAPTPAYHPETVEKPAPVYHPQAEAAPAPTYHPQTEEKPAPVYHSQAESSPAATYHPQTEEKPAQVSHPQSEPQHESAPAQTHPQAAPAAKPAASQGGNKDKTDGQNPQGH
jgi:hypothetical protein